MCDFDEITVYKNRRKVENERKLCTREHTYAEENFCAWGVIQKIFGRSKILATQEIIMRKNENILPVFAVVLHYFHLISPFFLFSTS